MTLMTLPSAATSSNYRLLPAGMFYKTRQKPVLGVVLHITAGLQDLGLVGTDESSEGTIRWALDRKPRVSWHAGCDTDGVELCIPDWYTAWHAAGVNSATVGLEISKLDVDWSDMKDEWIERTLRNAARYLAAIVKKYNLPLTLQTSKASVDSAIAANRKFGFVYHSTTSAGTRSDPGKNFPIERLFKYIREELAGTTNVQEDDMADLTDDNARQLLTAPRIMVDPDNPASRTDFEQRVTPSYVMEYAANKAKATEVAVKALATKVDALTTKIGSAPAAGLDQATMERIYREEIRAKIDTLDFTEPGA